ncbi:MAG: LamB/YcsF family protein [Bacteroidetes bacterium]|nr:LamB/YcsF family protein [Bacteroidota bacterium]MDA1268653.1 LamB/YcsF family protein [Bacteroidota bacterium]
MPDSERPKKPLFLPQINCDLGEGVAWEEEIFPFIDAASIACGGHYGTQETLNASLLLAKRFGKEVGAHPSYPDRVNFGRVTVNIPTEELIDQIAHQIGLFVDCASVHGVLMDHIKFHGALYNDATTDPALANLLTGFLAATYPTIPLLVPQNSQLQQQAQLNGIPIRLEVFADRSYASNYQLSPRSEEGSLLQDLESVDLQVKRLIFEGKLVSQTGVFLPIEADTLCFHGDNPSIINFLPTLRKRYWT